MIIQCEKCQTKFNLDEFLLKRDGSMVKCSLCKHIFVAYPPEQVSAEGADTAVVSQEELKETAAMDLPPISDKEAIEAGGKGQATSFDNTFEQSLEDLDKFEAVSPEDLHDLLKEEATGKEKPLDRAFLEEQFPATDIKEKAKEEFRDYDENIGAVQTQDWSRTSNFLPIFLVVILVLMAAIAAIFFWAPELIPDSLSFKEPAKKPEFADIGVRRLSFKAVNGFFINSEKAGNLFVIQGMVSNDYPKSRSFILIRGSILDDKGNVVRRKLSYAGNIFKKEEIKALPLERIKQAMKNRYGMDGKNLNVASGSTVPFMIVFENLPENLGEFTVEAVSSSIGT